MRLLALVILFVALVNTAQEPAATPSQSDLSGQPEKRSTPEKSTITVPAGTKVVLALTTPVWAKTAKPGDNVYSATAFPVAVNNDMAIPPGTYVEGKIDALTRPTWRSNRAEFQMHFTKMIFANGYTVELPATPAKVATATVHVQISSRSDILLDNGSQIEMVLQSPLALDAESVAAAVRRSKPLLIAPVKSATLCRPIPATPGTSDTVIPGTPATPPTVIPGGPGMPDTVIPGSPGTPSTVIPGIPGSPGVSCPDPPIVISGPNIQDVHTESFQVAAPLRLAGKQLSAGIYQVTWAGIGPVAEVDIMQNGKRIVRARARIVSLDKKPSQNELESRNNPDGSVSLESLRFAGGTFALFFD